jgi:hypothetical protein
VAVEQLAIENLLADGYTVTDGNRETQLPGGGRIHDRVRARMAPTKSVPPAPIAVTRASTFAGSVITLWDEGTKSVLGLPRCLVSGRERQEEYCSLEI